jgi:outer membrane protein assembly factor BamB
MKTKIFLLTGLIFLSYSLCSCDWFINSNASAQPLPLWVSPLTTGELIQGLLPVIDSRDNVLSLGYKNGVPILIGIDKKTGKSQWEWKEFRSINNLVTRNTYVYQDILVLIDNKNIYGINVNSGKTQWVYTMNEYVNSWVKGFSSYFFYGLQNSLLIGNSLNGSQTRIQMALPQALFTPPIAFIDNRTSDTILVAGANEFANDSMGYGWHKAYLTAYNWNKKQILYQLLQVEGRASSDLGFPAIGRTVFLNNRVYSDVGRSIQCNDILTGKLIWRRKFLGSFYFSSIIAADNKIFGNSDDEGIMYALNPDTGDIIWQEQTSSAAGNMLFMNGVVYMVGLGDGKLHALDAQTGKHIWKLTSPDYESSQTNSFFEDAVSGDGQNIYVRSFLNLYCYKAAK